MMADKTLLPLGSHGKSSSGGIEMTRAISGGGDSATNVALRAVQEDDDGDDGNKNKKLGVFAISSSRLLCLIMALDLMTLSVQIPSLPAVFESHGMDLRWQGWVASIYGVISFFVAPALARVSDSVGRVPMLKLSAVGSILGALGSLYATGKWSFIAARTMPAFLKCSPPISQAYIVDVSQGSVERSKNLGMLGASFGMAFVLGPPVGGAAADRDARLPFLISFLESVLLLGTLQLLPESKKLVKRAESKLNGGETSSDSEKAETVGLPQNGGVGEEGKGERLAGGHGKIAILKGPGGKQMGWGFHDRFCVVLAESLYHTAYAPFLTKVLGFPAGTIGILLSFMGMVNVLTNMFLVGSLTRRFREGPLMAGSLLALAVGWVMWSAVSGSIPSILAALTMAGVGGNVFQTVNKAAVAKHAPSELVGTVMGMSGALETFARSVARPLSGYLFNAWGARGVPLSCSCIALYVAFMLTLRGVASESGSGDSGDWMGGGLGKDEAIPLAVKNK